MRDWPIWVIVVGPMFTATVVGAFVTLTVEVPKDGGNDGSPE